MKMNRPHAPNISLMEYLLSEAVAVVCRPETYSTVVQERKHF